MSIQPLLPSLGASVPGSLSPIPPMGGSSKSKTATKGIKARGSKRKAAELVEEPMDDEIRVTGIDIGDPPTNPINSHPPCPPAPKHIHLGAHAHAKIITFIPLAVKAMSSSKAYTSSSTSSRILIINDSFHKMLDYKVKHNKFPPTYEDMVAFLNEVQNNLDSHSIRIACP